MPAGAHHRSARPRGSVLRVPGQPRRSHMAGGSLRAGARRARAALLGANWDAGSSWANYKTYIELLTKLWRSYNLAKTMVFITWISSLS